MTFSKGLNYLYAGFLVFRLWENHATLTMVESATLGALAMLLFSASEAKDD